jgi:Protein of unknown function (DUF1214)
LDTSGTSPFIDKTTLSSFLLGKQRKTSLLSERRDFAKMCGLNEGDKFLKENFDCYEINRYGDQSFHSLHAKIFLDKVESATVVDAFWSVTMYDAKTQFLIENPINRYLINAPMVPDMKKNADGSLTVYIQNKSPGPDKEANWLPAPDGPIYLVMRLYWPKATPPSILPAGEGTWRPPGVKQVS